MVDAETGSCLTYNGEIYNFRELKRELEAKGFVIRSRGDTEVLLKALVCWGPDALLKLRGMYAFSFWDAVRKQLILARDPLGIKPLYYSHRAGFLVFGSEIKIIRASCSYTVSREAVASFLTYGAVIRPATIFEEVSELEPGRVLAITPSGDIDSSKRFWTIPANLRQETPLDGDEHTEAVGYALRRAVQRHLIADVETAVALSGGVDSSLIAVLAAQAGANIRLLTLAFSEKAYSEEVAASRTAQHTGLPHKVITVTPEELVRRVPVAVASMDQPTVDGINTWIVSTAAASLGVKVLLSGLGGDEIFGGYTTFRKLPFLRNHPFAARCMAMLRRWLGLPLAAQFHKIERLRRNSGLRELYLLQRCIRWQEALGGLDTNECPPNGYAVPGDMWNDLGSCQGMETFSHVAGLELQFYMANQLLRDADVFSMAASIELRVPLLDLDLVVAALSLPGRRHVGLRHGKRLARLILHKACPQLRLPMRKRGFTLPWNEWLRGGLKATVAETVLDRGCQAQVGLNAAACEQTLREFLNGNPLVPWQQIWSLFVLFRWLDRNRAIA